jgi:hypothetical protein
MRIKILRGFIPLLGLVLLAIFAALYIQDSNLYNWALNSIGVPAYTYPFIDWEVISSAIKCWQEGVNVFVANPCDIMNRVHLFSPILLRFVFIPTDRAWTMPMGLGVVVAFLISLFWVVKPVSWKELPIFAFACASPMVIYALERANSDVLIFIMLVVAGVLCTGPLANRILCYALMLLAGLFKYYPLAVLLTALRERPRTFVAITALVGLCTAAVFFGFREEQFAVVKSLPPWTSGISAGKIPFVGTLKAAKLFPGLQQFAFFPALPYTIMLALLIITAAQVLRLAGNRNVVSAFSGMAPQDSIFLVIGAALIVAFFFAGRSDQYKGIHLIFVVAGLLAMRRVANSPAARAMVTQTVIIVVFLMWDLFFRHPLDSEQPGLGYAVYGLVREVLWWRLAAVLLAMLAIFGAKSELFASLWQWRARTRLSLAGSRRVS